MCETISNISNYYNFSINSNQELEINCTDKKTNNIIFHKNQSTIFDFIKHKNTNFYYYEKIQDARRKLHRKIIQTIIKRDIQNNMKYLAKYNNLTKVLHNENMILDDGKKSIRKAS